MSEKPGYIPLYRKIQDNFLWKERRVFSKAEAWIDILMEARFSDEPETFVIGTKILQCSYGEVLYSMDTWADRWRWSKSKVKRVLDLFAKCSMIELKNETVTTRISVLNYSKYDPRRNGNETQVKRKRNARETHVEPTEEGREGEEGKECSSCPNTGLEVDHKVMIMIPTNKVGVEFPVHQSLVDELAPLYPSVDVVCELKKMRAWSITNATKRKTWNGMTRFLNTWLSRAQDKGGSNGSISIKSSRRTLSAPDLGD